MDQVLQDQLCVKAAGKFKLVSLIQKRMRELVRGLPALVDAPDPANYWDIVVREVMEGKVELVLGDEAEHLRKELSAREADETPVADAKAGSKAAPAALEEKKA